MVAAMAAGFGWRDRFNISITGGSQVSHAAVWKTR